jgi:outer membrane protein assembly factor BamB
MDSQTEVIMFTIRFAIFTAPLATMISLFFVPGSRLLQAGDWPSFRGPQGTGVSPEKVLPETWSATKNVAWRVQLPDRGNSTPIVWHDRVFVTQATDEGASRALMCFGRANGKLLWTARVKFAGEEPTNSQNPYCSSSPATDGEHVVACFGSAGLYCYTLDGRELWHRHLENVDSWHGCGASLVIHDGLCFVNFGPGTNSALYACDVKNGNVVWKVALQKSEGGFGFPGGFSLPFGFGPPGGGPLRNERPGPATLSTDEDQSRTMENAGRSGNMRGKGGFNGSWCTPVILHMDDHDELIVVESSQIASYEPKTGKQIWKCSGLPAQVFASPAIGEGVLVAMGHTIPSGTQIIAVKLGGKGDITKTDRLWQKQLPREHIGSGIVSNGCVFLIADNGTALCLDVKTGETKWQQRLKSASGGPAGSWSSIVRVGNRLLITNHSGVTFVVKASPTFELLQTNPLSKERTCASLALSDGQVFLRTHEALWCLGSPSR